MSTQDAAPRWASVPDFAARQGVDPATLPRSVRLILEAALRGHAEGRLEEDGLFAILHRRGGEGELRFPIGRVLLQDASGLPLLADLAALRDAVAERGGDPGTVRPTIPVDLVIDHSVQTDHHGTPDALDCNMAGEFARNRERYAFVAWAAQAFDGLRVVPPGNGIVHQVHLERLAELVSERDGWIFCDSVIGTDSHTTMVNGLGVLGWGVGGIEAEAALLGDLQDLPSPDVIGVELAGAPADGVLAADLALALTERLRAEGVVGAFLEFYGDGLDALSVADRCTIANMAPEYGATLALFPTDAAVLEYLAVTGRPAEQVERVRAHLTRQGLLGVNEPDRITYDRRLRVDLSAIGPCVAGPVRPDQRVALDALPRMVRGESPEGPWDGRVALAAITSCTNTANPASMVTAGLLARNAVARGLTVGPFVKTVLAPGSRAVTGYLAALGLLEPLERLGFHVAAYGCAVCVGNSGGLVPGVEEALSGQDSRSGGRAVAVLSGNRNFEARVHPALRAAYLMNPALVVAFALAGRIDLDLTQDPLGPGDDGRPVRLADLWPDAGEVAAALRGTGRSLPSGWFATADWQALRAGAPVAIGGRFPWDPASDYFVRPSFFDGDEGSALVDLRDARPLLLLGDAVTTDHISPVGPIDPDSPAAAYLGTLGVAAGDLNSYAARRGNHEVMLRGTFANRRLRNRLVPERSGPVTRHMPSGEEGPLPEVATRYRAAGVPTVVVAGRRYGSGSARDWAAKGTALLGIRAVIARSFERIHRSNLVRLGVLPVEIGEAPGFDEALAVAGDACIDLLFGDTEPVPFGACTVRLRTETGTMAVEGRLRADTTAELAMLRDGDLFHQTLKRWA
jgi:aconitate hydratase